MSARVRFAPSPTGDLHIGGVRTALYNFLFARHEKGTFVLRIEDTDQKRNREDSLATIKDGLAWCGLSWDEGPHYQSLRLERYRECAAKLEKDGRAYWQEDPEKGKALRYRIDRGPCAWEDLVHGPSKMDTSADPDLVIIKSDGFPTYNFAVVIDDHDMEISDVLRGDEHYSNTPKQISLYRAFGWTPPKFGHMPLIFAPDGTKISKRETEKYNAMGLPVTVGDCRRLGYLPEATINFLALLGWSPGNDLELMTLDVMVEKFTIDRIGNTPAKFLVDKLLFMNAHYIKKTSLDRLVELCRPYLGKAYDLSRVPADKLKSAVAQQQERLKRLDEIVPLTKFFFAPVAYDPAAVDKFLKNGGFDVLRELKPDLQSAPDFGKERVETLLKGVAGKRGLKLGGVAQPLRVAVTGTAQSPPIHDVLDLLGRDAVLQRIDQALALSEKP
ncbi:MAG TPA: glutamate--tRNA ligase [Planctomycetota bacterium]|nr:glutamate--tRNA ligase [Planctomycetota bacterium]